MQNSTQSLTVDIFGGDRHNANGPWSPTDWVASDDRVRGGRSHSKLSCSPAAPIATFHGHLDITALGGAGFASQRTDDEDRWWDLSDYDAIELNVDRSDGKMYTFILKDEIRPKRPDGREQSTISWEYDFRVAECGEGNADAEPEINAESNRVYIRWSQFKPTYRGRDKKDAEPLDLANVRRMSLMMRSFFGTQEGDFSLSIRSIAAVKEHPRKPAIPSTFPRRYRDDPDAEDDGRDGDYGNENSPEDSRRQATGWFEWVYSSCVVC